MIKNTQPLCLALVIAATLTACDEESTSDARMYVPYNLDSVTYPNDILLTDDDGTIEMKVETSGEEVDYRNYENVYGALDGWSTGYPIIIPLMGPEHDVDPASLASSVIIFNAEEGSELVYDKDFTAEINEDGDLTILPMTVLSGSTTYVLALTDGLKNSAGESVLKASINYQKLEDGDDLGHSLGNEASSQIQNNHNLVAGAAGGQNIVYSAQFTTQSIYPVMDAAVEQIPAEIRLTNLKKNLRVISGTEWTAELTIPYYLELPTKENCRVPSMYYFEELDPNGEPVVNPEYLDDYKEVMADPVAACPSLYSWWKDDSDNMVHGNNKDQNGNVKPPVAPKGSEEVTIPVVIYTPAGANLETETFPTTIMVHGITGHRESAKTMVKSITEPEIGTPGIVIAIDQPLHGGRGIDLDDETTNYEITASEMGDGSVHGDKGFFLNLASPLTLRDNLRQAILDQLALRKALNNPALLEDGGEFRFVEEGNVHLIGHSLGGIVSTMVSEMSQDPDQGAREDFKFNTVTLAVPGMGLTDLTINSPLLGSEVEQKIIESPDIQLAVASALGLYEEAESGETPIEVKVSALDALEEYRAQNPEEVEKLEQTFYGLIIADFKTATQAVVDAGDPANFTSRQKNNPDQPILLLEAAGDCSSDVCTEFSEYIPDNVVINSLDGRPLVGTEPLIKELDLKAVSESILEGNGVIKGAIRVQHGGHGTYLFGYEGAVTYQDDNFPYPIGRPSTLVPEGVDENGDECELGSEGCGLAEEGFTWAEVKASLDMQQKAVSSFVNSSGQRVFLDGTSPVH